MTLYEIYCFSLSLKDNYIASQLMTCYFTEKTRHSGSLKNMCDTQGVSMDLERGCFQLVWQVSCIIETSMVSTLGTVLAVSPIFNT